jgi:hypothetical protein
VIVEFELESVATGAQPYLDIQLPLAAILPF